MPKRYKYSCDYCDRTSRRPEKIEQHIRTFHRRQWNIACMDTMTLPAAIVMIGTELIATSDNPLWGMYV